MALSHRSWDFERDKRNNNRSESSKDRVEVV